MSRTETVKIKSDAHPSGYITVNKDQSHKYESKPKADKPLTKRKSYRE